MSEKVYYDIPNKKLFIVREVGFKLGYIYCSKIGIEKNIADGIVYYEEVSHSIWLGDAILLGEL